MTGLLTYPKLWLRILRVYFSFVTQFGRIHPDLPSGKFFETLSEEQDQDIVIGSAFATEFNSACEGLKADLTQALKEPNYEALMAGCFAVRAAECVVVWALSWRLGLLVGLLQFVVAPLSLTGSFIRLFTNLSDCIIHYALNAFVVILLMPVLSTCEWLPKVHIDLRFVLAFFTIDFALNVYVYLNTAERWSLKRLAMHMCYGTFNTKTYFVVVLGCLYGLQFDLVVIVMVSLLMYGMQQTGLQGKLLDVCGWSCFQIAFYVEHRLGHMPIVYQHAHKMHHYLHDTTAFDAHIYGSGLNEEFFWILAESLPCLAFPNMAIPYFINGVVLHSSWTNKGGHSRTDKSTDANAIGMFDADNFHADHHTFHRANFGSSTGVFLDFYFGTQAPGTTGVCGTTFQIEPDPADASRMILRKRKAPSLDASSGTETDKTPEPSEGPRAVCHAPAPLVVNPVPSGAGAGASGEWWERVISFDELAQKRSVAAGGVWVALHGAVFDLTMFHRIHPGGPEVLLMYAGTDATNTFVEIGHSDKAKEMSKKRLIGVLEGVVPSGFVAEILASVGHDGAAPNVDRSDLSAPLLATVA